MDVPSDNPGEVPSDRWARAVERLVDVGALANDAHLGAALHAMIRRDRRSQRFDSALVTCIVHARLAVDRHAVWVAADALESLLALRREVDGDATLDRDIATLMYAIACAAAQHPVALPVPAEGLLLHLQQLRVHDLELEAVWLQLAHAELPADVDIAGVLAQVSLQLGRYEEAAAVLRSLLAIDPTDERAGGLLSDIVLADADSDGDRFEALEASFVDTQPRTAAWLRARVLYRERRFDECIAICATLLEDSPDAEPVRQLSAMAARNAGAHGDALVADPTWMRPVLDGLA
jgi:tetratricopeptide (TPR) repeat protein